MSTQKTKARLSTSLVAVTNYVRPPDPPPEDRNRVPCPIGALAALPGGRVAAAIGFGIQLWDLETSAASAMLPGHHWTVDCLLTLRDGRLASGAGDNLVRIWDTEGCVETACLHTSVDPMARDWDGTPTGYSVDTVKALAELDDDRLAAAHFSGAISVWDLNSGKMIGSGGVGSKHLSALAVLPDGRLAAGTWEKSIGIWDPTSFRYTGEFDDVKVTYIGRLAVLPDGRLASTSSDHIVRIWDPATGHVVHALEGHTSVTGGLALGPSGTLVSGSEDKTIRLWDTAAGQELSVLEHDSSVTCLLAIPNGHLVVGDKDGKLLVLEVLFD